MTEKIRRQYGNRVVTITRTVFKNISTIQYKFLLFDTKKSSLRKGILDFKLLITKTCFNEYYLKRRAQLKFKVKTKYKS
jgi:hypothetical protein